MFEQTWCPEPVGSWLVGMSRLALFMFCSVGLSWFVYVWLTSILFHIHLMFVYDHHIVSHPSCICFDLVWASVGVPWLPWKHGCHGTWLWVELVWVGSVRWCLVWVFVQSCLTCFCWVCILNNQWECTMWWACGVWLDTNSDQFSCLTDTWQAGVQDIRLIRTNEINVTNVF